MGTHTSKEAAHEMDQAKAEKSVAGYQQDGHGGIDEPIIVTSIRSAQNIDKYQKAHHVWSEACRKKVPGMRTALHSLDMPTKGNKLKEFYDIQCWSSMDGFRRHIKMTDFMLMKNTMAMMNSGEKPEPYKRGYTFGAWEKKAMMMFDIPHMFALPVFPIKMTSEMRDRAAGFLRKQKASSPKPPIIIVQECTLKGGSSGLREQYIKDFQKLADKLGKDPKILAFYCTKEAYRIKLTDPTKKRNPNFLVNLYIFETEKEFATAYGATKKLEAVLDSPPTGQVWAADKSTAAKIGGLLNGTFKTFPSDISDGYSDHCRMCTPCSALTKGECMKMEAAAKKS